MTLLRRVWEISGIKALLVLVVSCPKIVLRSLWSRSFVHIRIMEIVRIQTDLRTVSLYSFTRTPWKVLVKNTIKLSPTNGHRDLENLALEFGIEIHDELNLPPIPVFVSYPDKKVIGYIMKERDQ